MNRPELAEPFELPGFVSETRLEPGLALGETRLSMVLPWREQVGNGLTVVVAISWTYRKSGRASLYCVS
jgi:hypothetical protein